MSEKITFSFGKNWKDYLNSIDGENIAMAEANLLDWIGKENILNRRVLDIGSGSGIHSLCFARLGAKEVFSFDYDINSVEATKFIKRKFDQNYNWQIEQGSILDTSYISKFGKYDVVYSWGVLHHTGQMWQAIDNAASLVGTNGLFFISIYAKGPRYKRDLELKQLYNSKTELGKKIMVWRFIWSKIIFKRIKRLKNPFTWNKKKDRGMYIYHDVIDWLGGLPYEVAHVKEISDFLAERGFSLIKSEPRGEGACHRLLYKRN